MSTIHRLRLSRPAVAVGVLLLLFACASFASAPGLARAAVTPSGGTTTSGGSSSTQAAPTEKAETSIESAAAKAGDTARTVAMSLIGLALAVASIVLAFRRDFKEAAGVFAVGIVAVLLATPAGLSLLRDTVTSLFGA
jgi:asparagine N-glycosylation enzyme membrane subunit Stt3